MRALTVLLLASVSFAPVSLMAQVQGAPQTAQGNAPRVHLEDGGVSEMMGKHRGVASARATVGENARRWRNDSRCKRRIARSGLQPRT